MIIAIGADQMKFGILFDWPNHNHCFFWLFNTKLEKTKIFLTVEWMLQREGSYFHCIPNPTEAPRISKYKRDFTHMALLLLAIGIACQVVLIYCHTSFEIHIHQGSYHQCDINHSCLVLLKKVVLNLTVRLVVFLK